tara:strand:- start:1270 stop:6189 length:4920 start_codon:yes stop_codon:yes gene_type:complete
MPNTIDGIFSPFEDYVKKQLDVRKAILSDPIHRAAVGGWVSDRSQDEGDAFTDQEIYELLTDPEGHYKYSTEFMGTLEDITVNGQNQIDFYRSTTLLEVKIVERRVNPEAFFALTTEKQATIRMCSAVNLKQSFKQSLEYGEGYLLNNNGTGLAKQYILEGGTRFYNRANELSGVREGFVEGHTKSYKQTDDNRVGISDEDKSRAFTYGDRNIRANASDVDGYGIVPMPGITDAEIRTKSPDGSLREAKVNFQCHNRRQLEMLEMLYMRPGYPVLLEWGWDPYVSNDGSVEDLDLSTIIDDFLSSDTTSSLTDLNSLIRKKKRDSSGNYDGFIGYVKNFTFKVREDGGYECVSEIIAHGEILESLKAKQILTDVRLNKKQGGPQYKKLVLSIDTSQYHLPVPQTLTDLFSPLELTSNTVTVSGSSYRAAVHSEVDDSYLFYLKSIKANLDKAGDAAFLRYHQTEKEILPGVNTEDTGDIVTVIPTADLKRAMEDASDFKYGYVIPEVMRWKEGDPIPSRIKMHLQMYGWTSTGQYQYGYRYVMEDGEEHLLTELNRVGNHYLQGYEIIERLYTSITKRLSLKTKDEIVEPLPHYMADGSDYDPSISGNTWEGTVGKDEMFVYEPIDSEQGVSGVQGQRSHGGAAEFNFINHEGQGIRALAGGTILRQITLANIDYGDNKKQAVYGSLGSSYKYDRNKQWKQITDDQGYKKNIYVRWDMLCQIMNNLVTEQYTKGEPLVEWTYTIPNTRIIDLDSDFKYGMGKSHYIPYAPPTIDTMDPSWDPELHKSEEFHPMLGQSFNHNVCLMPHMPICDRLFEEKKEAFDDFAFAAYPDKGTGKKIYGPEEYIINPDHSAVPLALAAGGLDSPEGRRQLNRYSLIGIRKEDGPKRIKNRLRDTSFETLATNNEIAMHRNSIGAVFFNLDHLIRRYEEMAQDRVTETDISGRETEVVRLKEDFSMMDYIKKIWEDVNEACAGFYKFQISTEHENPHKVRIIDKTISGIPDKNKMYHFEPQGLKAITRDFYYDSKIDKDMASMISIAAQAPNEINNLQSLSFRAFHKNIFNRFTDSGKINPEQEASKNNQARRRLQKDVNQYVQTLNALKHYLGKLNDGNFEVEWVGTGDDAQPKQRLIGHDTAIRYAKQLGKMKNEILMRVPLKDKEGNDNTGPTYKEKGEDENGDMQYEVVKGTEKKLFAGIARDAKIHERNAVIPLSFNIKMDGIAGVIPLQMFKVAKEKLPIGYQDDRIAFIVHSENHKITAGQDWTVELGGQLVFTSERDILKGDALAQNPPLELEAIEDPLPEFNPYANNQADEINGRMEGLLIEQDDPFNSGWINPFEHKPKLGTPWGQQRPRTNPSKRHGGGDFKARYNRPGKRGGSIIRAPMDGKVRLVSIYKTTSQRKASDHFGITNVEGSSTHDEWCGNEVIIDHYLDGPRDEYGYLKNKNFSGLSSKYCHLKYDPDEDQSIFVQPGQEVVRGQHFGYLGGGTSDTGRGNTSGPHLHYEVRVTGNQNCNYYINGRTACGMTPGKDDGTSQNAFLKNPRQPDWWDELVNGNRVKDTSSEDPRNYMFQVAQGSDLTLPWDTTIVDTAQLIIDYPQSSICNPAQVAADPTMQKWNECVTRYKGINYLPGGDYEPTIAEFM